MIAIDNRDLPDRDGFQLTAYKVEDTDSSPHDADCYGDADIHAWNTGQWCYVGVIVTASREGVELGSDSIWAVEDGTLGNGVEVDAFGYTLGDRYGDYDVPGEAVADAKATLDRLCVSVNLSGEQS